MANQPETGGRWYRDPKTGKLTRTEPKATAGKSPVEASAPDVKGDSQ